MSLVGMCNPLLDISAEVPMTFLEKYGVERGNAILAGPEHAPLYAELQKDFPVQYIAGGAGQNSIRVAQWMVQTPNQTAYFGAVGSDEYGAKLSEEAKKDGVNVCYQTTDTKPTGTCGVLVTDDGERSLVANLAAAETFNVSHLDTPDAMSIIEGAKIYYITGFFLTVSVDSMLKLATDAATNGKIFTMNLSAPFLMEVPPLLEQMDKVMPYTDYVFGNESEAACYGKVKGYGDDLNEVALKLAAEPKQSGTRPRVVVFTQGSECTIVACEGKVTRYDVDPLPKEMLIDTNGAGDAFVGGFLSQMLLGKPIAECVRAGHWAGRTIIQQPGCTFPKKCDFI